MKSLAAVTNPSCPLNPPILGDFEREILSESSPKLGAEVLNNEAEKLHRIHIVLVVLNESRAVAGCGDESGFLAAIVLAAARLPR